MHSLALGSLLAQADSVGRGLGQFLPILLIVAVFYLVAIRPQQRRAKQHQELVGSVGVGDRVVTIGGIHGTVETVDEDTMQLEIAPGTSITMLRAAVARKVVDAQEPTGDQTFPDVQDTP